LSAYEHAPADSGEADEVVEPKDTIETIEERVRPNLAADLLLRPAA
jgi:hypothetical protein